MARHLGYDSVSKRRGRQLQRPSAGCDWLVGRMIGRPLCPERIRFVKGELAQIVRGLAGQSQDVAVRLRS